MDVENLYQNSVFIGSSNFRRMLGAFDKPWFYSGNRKMSHHLCVGGQTIRKCTRRVMDGRKGGSLWHMSYENKNVIVMIGLNNLLQGQPIRTILHQYRHFLCVIKKLGASKIFLCSVPECRQLDVSVFNDFIRTEAHRPGMYFIDVNRFIHNLSYNPFIRDGIHFKRRCMKELMEYINQCVREG